MSPIATRASAFSSPSSSSSSRATGLAREARARRWSRARARTPSSSSRENAGVDVPTLLNNTPHARETRAWFYDDCAKSIAAAVTSRERRIKIKTEFPELNVSGDVYRVGTTLELVRRVATTLARDGMRVKVCVQRSMGKGVFQALPLSLSGVSKLLELMDWDDDVADAIVPNGGISGEDGSDADAFILVQPQNIVGYSILPYIAEMEEVVGDKPMIMINPRLDDIQSAGNVMSVRGRKERMEAVAAWKECYHFRLLYRKPYFHPIYGALRFAYYENEWELYKRTGLRETEKYELLATYDAEPDPEEMTKKIWG
jgi:adenylate kinase